MKKLTQHQKEFLIDFFNQKKDGNEYLFDECMKSLHERGFNVKGVFTHLIFFNNNKNARQ